jgi:hypothetical protein
VSSLGQNAVQHLLAELLIDAEHGLSAASGGALGGVPLGHGRRQRGHAVGPIVGM